VGDKLGGMVVMVANVSSATTSLFSAIVGPCLMMEISQGGATEGTPDLYIAPNFSGFSPDVTRSI